VSVCVCVYVFEYVCARVCRGGQDIGVIHNETAPIVSDNSVCVYVYVCVCVHVCVRVCVIMYLIRYARVCVAGDMIWGGFD